MNISIGPQALASRFNDDEGVWRRYQQKRGLRRLRGAPRWFPDEVLDHLDWCEAEREGCATQCVGQSIP